MAFALSLSGASADNRALVSNIKADEEIVFFPGIAWTSPHGQWHLPIQGCVSEPEPRKLALAFLRRSLQLCQVEVSPAENTLLAERARLFMADNERRKKVVVQLGSQRFALGKTGPDGWFRGEVVLSEGQVRALSGVPSGHPRFISFQASLPQGDSRLFDGKVLLIEAEGIVVVSDVDDTIKISDVTRRSALLRSTFLERFRPVEGMPDLYRAWAGSPDMHFYYVSASPWQLFAPLSRFIAEEGFPEGSLHLRQLRWNCRSVAGLFQSPEKYKLGAIEPLLQKFPRRRFVLIGDSGERDPEIYGMLARNYPKQIAAIFIRELDSPAGGKRYDSAFRGVDRSVWTCFREPATIAGALERLRNILNPSATELHSDPQ